MKRIVSYDYIISFLALVALTGIAIANIGTCDDKYLCTIILPIVYLCGFIFWGVHSSNEAVVIKKILMLLMCIKMVIFPCFVLINGSLDISRFNPQIFNYIPQAIMAQIFEYLVVLAFIVLSRWPEYTLDNNPIANEKDMDDVLVSKKAWRVLLFCIFIMLVCIAAFPSFLNRLRPIFFLDKTSEILWKQSADVALNSLPKFIYYPLNWLFMESRLALAYMLVIRLYKTRIKMSDGLKVFFSFIFIILILVLIVPDSVATSIYATISLFLLLYILYPSKKRSIVAILAIICLSVVSASFFLMPILSGRGISINSVASKLNAYFSGYVNTSASIAMWAERSSRIDLLAGDFLRSLPIIKGFFSGYPMSEELFNQVLGYDTVYNSQIIPLEGQGYYYFWYFGVIFFTWTHMKVLKSFYIKTISSHSTFSFYIFGLLTILMTFGLVMYGSFLNFSLILSQIPMIMINMLFVRRINNESSDLS